MLASAARCCSTCCRRRRRRFLVSDIPVRGDDGARADRSERRCGRCCGRCGATGSTAPTALIESRVDWVCGVPLSPTFPAGEMVFFIPWRVVAEESGAAHVGFGGAMLLDLLPAAPSPIPF